MEKKVLYIHGLSSSGASATVSQLRELLPAVEVIAPDVPVNPTEALTLLKEICAQQKPDIVIGTSMGGMFAQQMHGFRKILINPAFHVSEFMRQNIGTQPFMNPRKDGSTHYEITGTLCDDYRQMEQQQFTGITPFDFQHTDAFFGINDTLVNCREEYLKHYPNAHLFDGEHRLNRDVLQQVFVPFIHSVLNGFSS